MTQFYIFTTRENLYQLGRCYVYRLDRYVNSLKLTVIFSSVAVPESKYPYSEEKT